MKRMKREQLEKRLIDFLIISGVVLLALPFLKETIVSIQLQQSQLTVAKQLPQTIDKEETITMPTLKGVALNDTTINAYGFVAIDAIDFQQPLLVGVTNQQMLKGGVVMFPHRNLTESNFVIVGHHLGRHRLLFGLLNEAQVGMNVSVTYLAQAQNYIITEKKIVAETDLYVIDEQSAAQLTLITCPIPSRTTERLVIVAEPQDEIAQMNEVSKVDRNLDQKSFETLIQKQKKIWRKDIPFNWFLLIVILFVTCGCLRMVHKSIDRSS